MGVTWVSLVLLLFQFWVMGSGQGVGRSCGVISGALERDLGRDLYGIEVRWKRLVGEEELNGERKEFDEIPMILHHFLARHYGEVERSLEDLIQGLSMLAEKSLNGSVSSFLQLFFFLLLFFFFLLERIMRFQFFNNL